MRVDLATSPKVVRIASALRADRLRVIGGLHAVWCLFDVHSTDGRLDGYTLEALDDLIGFPGFGAAMSAVGWLDDEGESLCTPRFDEHNGQSAKRRAMETERKREARKVSAPDADKVRSREEKRREDKSSTDVEEKRASRSRPAGRPEGVAESVWSDFLAIRKAKRAPLTATAMEGIEREASKASMSLQQALQMCCARGWQGFKADWVANAKPTVAMPQAMSFAERDEQARRRRWEEMTGRKWPTEGEPFAGETIDATTLEIGHEPADQSN